MHLLGENELSEQKKEPMACQPNETSSLQKHGVVEHLGVLSNKGYGNKFTGHKNRALERDMMY